MHQMAPTTHRSARLLSRVYGFNNPKELATSLPECAVVADIGAGRSKLGRKIVDIRDDITWINLDPRYTSIRTQRRQLRSPDNLEFRVGDILDPPIEEGSCDAVFCSALLPHIIMTSPELGAQAVRNMAGLLNPDGTLYTAKFVNRKGNISPSRIEIVSAKEYAEDPDREVNTIVEKMTLHPVIEVIQKASNIASHYSGANRFS